MPPLGLATLLRPALVALLAAAWAAAPADAADTLTQIRARGTLRCGVSEGIPGFSMKGASGQWAGLDADFCRAVAAAALGDPGKVTFLPLRASARFPALQSRAVDLLARNTTWTLAREAGLDVQFPGVLFYDGQAFMVPTASAVKSLAHLKGATICVEKGTTHEGNLAQYFEGRGIAVTPLVMDSASAAADAFFAGRCGVYSSDASQLAAAASRAPAGRAFRILPERISKEPLAPVVRSGDDAWLTLVRWVLFVLVAAEEQGITQESLRATREPGRDTLVRRTLGAADAELAKGLGTDPDWAVRVVLSVGNYGEMFERNVGAKSPLKLERGANRPWTRGGLMYAPPMR
jgi:general L-amino acid transport system substrate-binding protein